MLDIETGENLIDSCLEEKTTCFGIGRLIIYPEEEVLPAEPPKG